MNEQERAAMQQALEALERLQNAIYNIGGEHVTGLYVANDAADSAEKPMGALRAALAQEPEPVCKCDLRTRLVGDGCEVCNPELAAELAQQPEPAQEPVAWGGHDLDAMVEAFSRVIEAHYQRANPFQNPIDMDAQMALRALRGFIPAMKAYTAPPQRPRLTDAEILDIIDAELEGGSLLDVARAIERKVREKRND